MKNFMHILAVLAALLLPSQIFSQRQPSAKHTIIVRPEFSPSESTDPYDLSPRAIKRPKVGLVLSGGGARGIAHIGVLKVLEQHHIPVDFIVGNSMGAIVGGLYAAGYTVAELESVALKTNWEDVLSLTEDTRRSELYFDQKQAQEHSFLLLRLDGLEPVIPSSISSGQRLTNFLTRLTLQGLYHPNPGFDDLKIRFRAVATDLATGRRVVLDRGPLAEALRATVTVPLLFAPLKRDSLLLVDGGLVSNVPVDIAKSEGCDIIIASNATSAMRTSDELNAPWEAADQIMSIMMQFSNEKQLAQSDVIITPPLGNHLSSDFSGLDSLIRLGEQQAERYVDTLRSLIFFREQALAARDERTGTYHSDGPPDTLSLSNPAIWFEGGDVPPALQEEIARTARGNVHRSDIEHNILKIFEIGSFSNVYAEASLSGLRPAVVYHVEPNPLLRAVRFTGNTAVHSASLRPLFDSLLFKPINYNGVRTALENVLRLYRQKGFSLARIDSQRFESPAGVLQFRINEGQIQRVKVEGNSRTEDYVIRREFPQEDGDLFNIRNAEQGIININSTGLFESILLDVRYEGSRPIVFLKVEEKPTNNIRLGLHADNERNYQGLIDLRDANLFGSGAEFGLTFASSFRNRLYSMEYRANRIFNTILTFNLRGYYRFDDIFTYGNSPGTTDRRWERISLGEYRQIKYGGTFSFGAQLERLGNVTMGLRMENQEIRPIGGVGFTADRYKLVSLKLGTSVDTENKFPFPTSGVRVNVNFEAATQQLGSQVSFSKFLFTYENYATVFESHTFRPKFTFGYADATLPLAEQFSLGGQNSFFGLREDDTRSKQIFLVNLEYRFRFPFKIVFDTFVKVRYDLGTVSDKPEEIQLVKFHHGVGAEFALDTPIGPASFGAGKSFFFRRDLKDSPLSTGPTLLYFSIGYGL